MTRPWEQNACNYPWEAAQDPYDRRVSVQRLRQVVSEPTTIGFVGYVGAEQGAGTPDVESELPLFTGLRANIQVRSAGRSKGPLPTDVVYMPAWLIIIPTSDINQYEIRDHDIITDDEGYRYDVGAAYWTGLGYELHAIRLTA